MSLYDPRERNLGRVRQAMGRFFPERQIVVLTKEQTRTVTLGTYFQASLFFLLLSLFLWLAVSLSNQMNHNRIVAGKEAEVAQSQAAYNDLVNQTSVYRTTITEVARELEADRDHEDGREAKPALDVAKEAGVAKEGKKSDKRSDGGNKQSNAAKNEAGTPELDGLSRELAQVEEELRRLSQQGSEKSVALTLELRKVVLQRDLAQRERATLLQKISGLETRISEMKNIQVSLAQKFAVIADDRIEEIKAAINKAGLNADSLLRLSEPLDQGRGGPFIPLDSATLQSPEAQKAFSGLNKKFSTLSALQELTETLPFGQPLEQWRVTSRFGARTDPFNGSLAIHEGVDMSAPFNAPVVASAPGKVVFSGWKGGYGRLVEIDHGKGITTRYAHLNKILVKRGDWVGKDAKIGLLGNSGRSTGPHLHYEVRVNGLPRNPEKFLLAGRRFYPPAREKS